jgi:hypothetical protein
MDSTTNANANVSEAKRAEIAAKAARVASAKPRKPSATELLATALARIEALETERASAKPVTVERGYRAYATKATPTAMDYFARWISREFPELGIALDPTTGRADDRTERIVTIASKAYKAFQASDLGTNRA